MAVLNGALSIPDGALVDVLIGVGRPHRQFLRTSGNPIPAPIRLRGLIDSGAECTCVDEPRVRALHLPLATASLANAPSLGGLFVGSQVEAGLTILHPSGDRSQHLLIPEITIMELSLGAIHFDALIGRDVLALGLFVIDGPAGTFTLAY
jgi:hypothetical protein